MSPLSSSSPTASASASASASSNSTVASSSNSSVDLDEHINDSHEKEKEEQEEEEEVVRRRRRPLDPDSVSQSSLAAALESTCWISMVNSRKSAQQQQQQQQQEQEQSQKDKNMASSASKVSKNPLGAVYSSVARRAMAATNSNSSSSAPGGGLDLAKSRRSDPFKRGLGCLSRAAEKATSVVKWVVHDFTLRHLVWIKLIFLFQSASMTVLYPYLNLHMKSLGLTVLETAAINAVVPVLFIFTPPIAGFLADRLGNFRFLLSLLTALGGLVALLLLAVPAGRDLSPYPDTLSWGVACGRTGNRARFQKLMLRGFRQDECQVRGGAGETEGLDGEAAVVELSFTPGTCGYLCPTRTRVDALPHFYEYRVIWPNRGGGFGISEIVDIVTLDSEEARLYHEPGLMDDSVFFPMNWTFHLSCDRIRPNDCIFNPIRRAPAATTYHVKVVPATAKPPRRTAAGGGRRRGFFGRASSSDNNASSSSRQTADSGLTSGPEFDVVSITPPETGRPVAVPVNCGAKEVVAQVISTVSTASLPPGSAARSAGTDTVDTRFSGCTLHCMVNIPRRQICRNGETGVTFDPAVTFWGYLLARTALGVLTAASLMMFEGAVMATIQEVGGDYGIQRFVGNFGAIVFAPLGGFVIDSTSAAAGVVGRPDFSAAVYIYLALKLAAAAMILCVKLDFRPPGEKILQNLGMVMRNTEVSVFLVQMMFAGSFWGFIEAFLFWHLDDLGASKLLMGWTVAIGMVTSLPFLVFSGPITDILGHINVIVLGMSAYAARMLGYSFISDPAHVYPFEALEGFTMALMMTSAVTYVARISGPRTVASVMGLMGALFFGVGKGSGALLGGTVMHFFGARVAFRYFAGNALVCAAAYLAFQCFYVRRRRRRRQQQQANAARGAENGARDAEGGGGEGGEGGETNKAYEDVIPREAPPGGGDSKVDEKSDKAPTTAEKEAAAATPPPPPPATTTTTTTATSASSTAGSSLSSLPPSSGPRSLTGGTRV